MGSYSIDVPDDTSLRLVNIGGWSVRMALVFGCEWAQVPDSENQWIEGHVIAVQREDEDERAFEARIVAKLREVFA